MRLNLRLKFVFLHYPREKIEKTRWRNSNLSEIRCQLNQEILKASKNIHNS